jgi:hypothetical protein
MAHDDQLEETHLQFTKPIREEIGPFLHPLLVAPLAINGTWAIGSNP